MAESNASGTLNLGFLTVLQETSGQLGGYLVTNVWGRPLEFRLSTAVQPNRVQQILYGRTMEQYICADLIGKTLFEKTGTAAQLIITDREAALDLRLHLPAPVIWHVAGNDAGAAALQKLGGEVRPAHQGRGALLCHPRFLADVPAVRSLLDRIDDSLDLSEPFVRIREAIGEARKLGVTGKN
ncbi:MAG: hypothetical protein JNM56_28940 [Planctomycetia bacterium]|nr:hypothetical protein [Planctomycetia bacterium]